MTRSVEGLLSRGLCLTVVMAGLLPWQMAWGETIGREFFGIDAVPGDRLDILDESLPAYRELGVGLLGRNSLTWELVEPEAPRGGRHQYQWDKLDREFKAYHDAGFKLQIVLISRSPWGCVVSSRKMPGRADGSPPKEKHWAAWGEFVSELVERYDGDGDRDGFPMNHRLIRILSVQGEVEFYGHWKKWGGTAENYHKLLGYTLKHAKKACPEVLVARAGISVGTLADTGPSAEMIGQSIERNPESRQMLQFLDYSFRHSETYDLFGLHANRDYTGIEPLVSFVRGAMKKAGHVSPVFIEDASSIYAGRGPEPYAKPENLEIVRQYEILKGGKADRGYREARRKVLEHQAVLTIKKATLALYSGVENILFTGYLDSLRSPAMQFLYGGFIDSRRYKETRGLDLPLKPAYHSLKMFVERAVGSDRQVRRLPDLPEDVYAFEFRKGDRSFYVLWCEGGSRKITVPWVSPVAVRTPIITEEGQAQGPAESITATGGKAEVAVSTIPSFLE